VSGSLFDKIAKIIADLLDIAPEKITPEATFIEDLGADSLDVVELMMKIEEVFEVDIPDEVVQNDIKTVQNLVDYLAKLGK